MKKKFVIIYSECFRSYIIYSDFIKKNYKNIRALVQIPNFPKKSGKINFLLLKKLFFSPKKYLFYQILQTTIYQFFSVMNKNSLSELSKKYNILLLRNNYLPNESFLKKKIYGFNKNDIILCSTAHILSENDLRIRNIILNFHEAPLPKFRGSALLPPCIKKVKLFRTSIIQPVDWIDAGKMELKSKTLIFKNLMFLKFCC